MTTIATSTASRTLRAIEIKDQVAQLNKELNTLLQGQTVEIISDFRDQPFGRNKPSQKGKTVTIRSASIDEQWNIIWVFVNDCRVSAELGVDVVLLEDSRTRS
jgi:hypothetical protein